MAFSNSLAIVLLTLLVIPRTLGVKHLDLIDRDDTKLVLVLASQRAGADLSLHSAYGAVSHACVPCDYATVLQHSSRRIPAAHAHFVIDASTHTHGPLTVSQVCH